MPRCIHWRHPVTSDRPPEPLSRDRLPRLSRAQEQLLADCYELGPATVRKIAEHHSEAHREQRDGKTVRHHLEKLVAKGYLTTTSPPPDGTRPSHRPAKLFAPAIPRSQFVASQFRRFFDLHIASYPDGPELLEKVLAELKARQSSPDATDS